MDHKIDCICVDCKCHRILRRKMPISTRRIWNYLIELREDNIDIYEPMSQDRYYAVKDSTMGISPVDMPKWLRVNSDYDIKTTETIAVFIEDSKRTGHRSAFVPGGGDNSFQYQFTGRISGIANCGYCKNYYRYLKTISSDVIENVCPSCRKIYGANLKKYTLGITQRKRDKLIEDQGGKCAICFKLFNYNNWKTSPCIDHDHETNRYRGMLCNGCNVALGFIQDNAETCLSMAEYLKNS